MKVHLLLLLPLAALAPEPAQAISLKDCLEIARSHAPALQAAAAQAVRSAHQVEETRATQRPSLRASAGFQQAGETPRAVFDLPGGVVQKVELGSAHTVTARAEGQLTLYSSGRDGALERAVQAAHDFDERSRDQSESDLVLRVSRAYYREVSAVRVLGAAGEALTTAREHLRLATVRVDAGSSPRLDQMQARVDVAQKEITLVQGSEGLRMGRVELESALGATLPALDTLEAPPAPTDTPDSAAALRRALDSRPELAAYRLAVLEASQRAAAARMSARPQFLLGGSAEYRAPNVRGSYLQFHDSGLNTYNLQASLSVSMPLLDGGAHEARAQGFEAARAIAEARLREASLGIRAELERAFSELRVASAVWGRNQLRLDAAREALRLADTSYREGVGLASEVRDAERSLLDARVAEANSLVDYWSARALLEHAMGAAVNRRGN